MVGFDIKGIFILMLMFMFMLLISTTYAKADIWNKQHDIDIWTAESLKSAGNITSKIRTVYSKAYKKWDDELNRLYKIFLLKVPESDKKNLRSAQRNWVKYRDDEFFFIRNFLGKNVGTLSLIVADERFVAFVRDRVLMLRGYLHIIDNPP